MTEYRLNCDADPTDYLTAGVDGGELEFFAHRGGPFRVSVYPTVEDARTFARGILALADEIDGGEVGEEGSKPADESATLANPRADHITQAKALLDEYDHTASDVLAVARFLAVE